MTTVALKAVSVAVSPPRVVAGREEEGVQLLPPEERFSELSEGERERDAALAVEEILCERPGLLSSRHVGKAVFPEEARRESIESEGEGEFYPGEDMKFLRLAGAFSEWERRILGVGNGDQATPSRIREALRNTKEAVVMMVVKAISSAVSSHR
ncbi:MAG: hypothetical protein OXF02_04645 [Simkaniaceae bacterium]|nr:hypothetical protein [Simkaniaceae bacterium]